MTMFESDRGNPRSPDIELTDDSNSRDDGQEYQTLGSVTSDQSSPLTLTSHELRQLSPLAAVPHDQLARRTPQASSENKKAPPKIRIVSSSPKERSKKKSPSGRNSSSLNSLLSANEVIFKNCIDAVSQEDWPLELRVGEVTKRFLMQVCPTLAQDSSQFQMLTKELHEGIALALQLHKR